MNNIGLLPFERNNYFKGKLLSAGSFEAEQRYFNDKRRLINRFAGGFGVVCGLDTVAVSDDKISVEAGIAIDGCGREIVADTSNIVRLSALNGYDVNKSDGDYYLYIEYAEKLADEVKLDNNGSSENAFDKVSENFGLYLTDTPLRGEHANAGSYYKQSAVIFKNEDAEIRLTVPKYIKAKEMFPIDVTVVPRDPSAEFRVNFTVGLKCVRYGNESSIRADIDSRLEKTSSGEYTQRFVCGAMNIVNDMAEFSVAAGELEIKTDDKRYTNTEDVTIRSAMTADDPSECARDNCRTTLFNFVNNASEIDVCLAKISFENYAITKIVEFPFGHYYVTNTELAIENAVLRDRIYVLEKALNTSGHETKSSLGEESTADISSGEAVIDLGIGGKAGKRFFSEEISHGLGLGNVQVTVGLKDESSDDECFVYGSQEIFDERSAGIKAELAVRVNNDTGTFKIGLRLLESAAEYNAVVHWTAVRKRVNGSESADRRIVIDNGAKTLGIRESAYFTVKFINLPPSDIRWSVLSENGGSIDDNGRYTAPNHSGVFKIRATYVGDSTITASAYIVVKP